ncbi:G-protein coupled receptor 143-like [Homalodisca vitripennis]|uniref:G-protein coupled receptor 143-like n=1 Tax=Homalodisca vitripennis TaxID=197043 RepID=UPI001EEC7E4C|nr:G-protein coupled receptor 143-like [Homalodisca vitripennis]XP_046681186.1 G-protein coupled receptor 143-like [Homalodisca vitripennis]XP_046685746.1 G-protein coupled receptor 143-like [Homalodisca vitripennis]XP_046685747.1 G-protein coupled receptor 143-like [Homalodisca vitripennis]
MSDPALQTFCCYPPGEGSVPPAVWVLTEINSKTYNYVCLVSSFIGILGAGYQMLPRTETPLAHRWYTMTSSRGRHIIQWLAFADLLATLGVFLRSLLKLNNFLYPLEDTSITYCAIFAAWIQYFYCVTWMWTLCYAVDMFLALRERPGHPLLYHMFCWLIPSVLTAVGLAILYLPNADCHNLGPDESAFLRILPNYLLTYLPMVTVMVANPILYLCSLRSVTDLITQSLAQYTRKERAIIDAVKVKFGLILLAFYICWLPNLINSLFLWFEWFNLPAQTVYVLLYIMAVVNPLQAFFNSLVYRRSSERLVSPFHRKANQEASETTPLVASDINGTSLVS